MEFGNIGTDYISGKQRIFEMGLFITQENVYDLFVDFSTVYGLCPLDHSWMIVSCDTLIIF